MINRRKKKISAFHSKKVPEYFMVRFMVEKIGIKIQ